MENIVKRFLGFEQSNEELVSLIARNLEDLRDLKFKDDDIFLITYPKCGTHWMQVIIWGILNKGAKPTNLQEMGFDTLEVTQRKNIETKMSPRTIKAHVHVDLLAYSAKAKYIHVTRNPFDCLLSSYNFSRSIQYLQDLTLDEFFDEFMEGNLVGGDYFEHLLGWQQHKNDGNYLHIAYEEMIQDHISIILKVAKFLGEEYYRELSSDEELLAKIQHHSSFAFMKSLPKLRHLKSYSLLTKVDWSKNNVLDDDEIFHTIEVVNKGQVGLFKKALSEEQKEKLRKKMEDKLRVTDLPRYWDQYLRDR